MRGADYLAKQGFTVASGPWTKLESIVLSVVIEVVDGSGVVLNSKNIAEFRSILFFTSFFRHFFFRLFSLLRAQRRSQLQKIAVTL